MPLKRCVFVQELSHSHLFKRPLTLLSSLTQEQVVAPPEPAPTPAQETRPPAAASPPPEESDLTWEDKEDKLDAENIRPNPSEPTVIDKKYQYKEGVFASICFRLIFW